jgi:carbon monoxide dehydrogenase subunit G
MSRQIESQQTEINCKPEKVFNFLGNFDNFESLLPDQVVNWQSTGDSCSFEIKGLATIGLRISLKTPYSKISMVTEGKLPFSFVLDTLIEESGMEQCLVKAVIHADMNPFIAVMAEKPLQKFVDLLLPKLKEQMEK